mgnify:CR=1 FL=1|jgi:uncharacterized ion transporter superfamily protein YfcC
MFFVGFSKTLLRMGGFRIGAGIRLKKSTAAILGVFILMFYMMWYSVILSGWMIYGFCWLFFYLPYKGISSAIKKSKEKQGYQS